MPTPEYISMRLRIIKAKTKADMEKLEKSLDRLFDLGLLTTCEFKKLDDSMFMKAVKIAVEEAVDA